jgi:hypothetical protein
MLVMALAGPSMAQPAPHPLSLLDVPFISQSEALCGGAAAAMVLRYWGERGLAAESFAHLVDRSASGIRTTALVNELQTRGWNAVAVAGTSERIATELGRGRPVMTLIEDRARTFHYIVIVGATAEAIVFHDPARAPLRVMGRDEFTRRWNAARRWMAVITPGARGGLNAAAAASPDRAEPAPPATFPSPAMPPAPTTLPNLPTPADPAIPTAIAETPIGSDSCEALLADGIRRAQANDLDAAERSLTSALACPGGAAMRELAGVRVLQQRWADVEALAATAARIQPEDAYTWRLLGTSRFVQNDRIGALEAWNRAGEPKLDLVSVAGLTRTRQRVVERLIDGASQSVFTPAAFALARRRLAELPSAAATAIEYVPVASALVELRATVNERPLAPTDIWSYAAIGGIAAARRDVEFSTGSFSGGGERLTIAWRFWPGRPRIALALDAPAPWGGVWGVQAFSERQPFDRPELSSAERSGGGVHLGNWISPKVRVAMRGGIERWERGGNFGTAGVGLRLLSRDDRFDARLGADVWGGAATFSVAEAAITARSSIDRRGRVLVARGGVSRATRSTPPDLWFGGDTGVTRPTLLRAHPLVAGGRLRVEQLGRQMIHGSAEAQHWWRLSLTRVAAAIFADAARVDGRLPEPGQGDVDIGAGARLAVPGLAGTFRADLAKGLRDGVTRWSFVYEP